MADDRWQTADDVACWEPISETVLMGLKPQKVFGFRNPNLKVGDQNHAL